MPDSDPTAVALSLSGVTAGYGRSVVLRDVSVSVPRSKIVALLGANGAGKTTLLRTASGLVHASQGRIMLGEVDATRLAPHARARHGLCLIPEGRGIFPRLTVRDNLRIQVPRWVPAAVADEQRQRALDAFPAISKRMGELAGRLSGGQQQMLALARAYLAKPEVILLDEVSMGLAPNIVEEIFDRLRALAATGVSMLLVEQYVTKAIDLADKVVLLTRGTVTFDGAPGELSEDAMREGYLGADIGASIPL